MLAWNNVQLHIGRGLRAREKKATPTDSVSFGYDSAERTCTAITTTSHPVLSATRQINAHRRNKMLPTPSWLRKCTQHSAHSISGDNIPDERCVRKRNAIHTHKHKYRQTNKQTNKQTHIHTHTHTHSHTCACA